MNVTIKPADESHFPAIFLLIQEFALFQKTPEKVKISLSQMQQDKEYFKCIVAENSKGEIKGFASYFFAYYSWSGKALYLDDLYVREDARNKGIGIQLLNALSEEARKERCYKMRWQVSKWNSDAIGFYRSMGAEIDETEINCDLVL
ncbi:MAG TPA: GNAT family N-acetyltransferase [Chitinophagaceae bacterium]|jgi:diamine N-acetyltransferase|nr:GNAT family N-acetyltransferase [Chitinophagaceae bacterium]